MDDNAKTKLWEKIKAETPELTLEWSKINDDSWTAVHTIKTGEVFTLRVWREPNLNGVVFCHYSVRGTRSHNQASGAGDRDIEARKEDATEAAWLLAARDAYLNIVEPL